MAKIKLVSHFAALLYGTASIAFIILSTSIVWHLLTAEFPTHSDVFWMGVQSGALAVLSIMSFALGLFFAYRVIQKIA